MPAREADGSAEIHVATEDTPFRLCARVRMWHRGTARRDGINATCEAVVLRWNMANDLPTLNYVFRSPGQYRLQVKVQFGAVRQDSEVLTVTVKEPPQAELLPVHLLIKSDAADVLERKLNANKEAGLRFLSLLIQRHPDSIYADYARMALGEYFVDKTAGASEPRPDDVWGTEAAKAWAAERAAAHLSQVTERNESLHLRAIHLLARLLRYTPAIRTESAFRKVYPTYRERLTSIENVLLDNRECRALAQELRSMEILFLPDDRLDQMVKYNYPDFVLRSVVMDELSRQTGVPLSQAAQIQDARMRTSSPQRKRLRDILWEMCQGRMNRWVREGNGYRLQVEPPLEDPIAALKYSARRLAASDANAMSRNRDLVELNKALMGEFAN